jgi:hypothetical protein
VFERRVSDLAQRACSLVQRVLAPDVVRVRSRLGTDHDGEDSIFFNALLSDDAARSKLIAVSSHIHQICETVTDASEYGWLCYFNFRSESEQVKRKDPEWE